MATQGGRPDAPLTSVLFDEPYRFDFFQAVRVFERVFRDRRPVGRADVPPGREVVRFRTRQTLEFPASQLHEVARPPESESPQPPPQVFVNFMGATGPLGVLPLHYTQLLVERARDKDTKLWEFIDIFNHRMISLFYRAWEKYRFPFAYERGDDDFTEYLFCLVGLGTRGLRGRLGLADEGLLYYSGLVAQRPRSASAIAAVLGDRFSAPARVRPFTGQWLKIEEDSLTRLGAANSLLGVSTIAGARVWDAQSKFRVRFGPLTLEQFRRLIPSGEDYAPANRLARFLAGVEFDFDFQLVLRAGEVPSLVLTTRARRRPQLGWTTWLKTQPFKQDDSQVVLDVTEVRGRGPEVGETHDASEQHAGSDESFRPRTETTDLLPLTSDL
ncbi:MAG TPA: type VI secretion system baseplate subunit TssG [Pyrinomonadaceae bacterium]|nr:type VI secretion system baseplate subunit TssG [Pyrinomonadaceae bacterium]